MDRLQRIDAYVDGELDPVARAAFEADMARDAPLEAEVGRRRRLAARLAAVYDPVLAEEPPLGLKLSAAAANRPGRARFGWWQWAAVAASLVVGVAVGRLPLTPAAPVASRDGALLAQAALDRALTGQLSADAGPIRVGLSFRGPDKRWCRTFQSSEDRLAGVACRQRDAWAVQALAAWSPAADGYRTAGADLPAPVLAAVDALAQGETADPSLERAARDGGWR